MTIGKIKYGSHDRADSYVEGIFSRGFLPHIIRPSRITHTSATLIDHTCTLTNDITVQSSSGILINDIADHFAIFYISVSKHKITRIDVFA